MDEEFNIEDITSRMQEIGKEFLRKNPASSFPAFYFDPLDLSSSYKEILGNILSNPSRLSSSGLDLWQGYIRLWSNASLRFYGLDKEVSSVAEPHKGDRRFRHKDWQELILFDFIKQSYLFLSRWIMDSFYSDKSSPRARKAAFFASQYLDAVAPSNFALLNPEVLREVLSSGGLSIVKGFKNILRDLQGGRLDVAMSDDKSFKLGENIATSKGKVIYRNEIMELIQYSPLRKKAYSVPLVIIPPWINKYYILDLNEEKSLVKFLLEKGHTVFMISWVNPSKELRHSSFSDYMLSGALRAIEIAKEICNISSVNALGYCVGGTLLSALSGYLAAMGRSDLNSITLLASLVDFSETGEISNFIDDKQIKLLDDHMRKNGYLDGSDMSLAFNMLRSNDLIWSFVVNNYLLGRENFPFDLLYWNSDNTRVSEELHGYYLRNMYIKNGLKGKDFLTLGGVKIDLSRVSLPLYILATEQDHIVPWRSAYESCHIFSSCEKKFVLSGSGHIAGVINPPSLKKYCYWSEGFELSADEFLSSARKHQGSWWLNWASWLALRAGKKGALPSMGSPDYISLTDAPGDYVRVK